MGWSPTWGTMKFAILYYNTEIELGLGTHPDTWVNYKTQTFDNGTIALHTYLTDAKDTSDILYLVRGESEEDFQKELETTRNNFQNKKWRDKLLGYQM